jgi:hypothetical protein
MKLVNQSATYVTFSLLKQPNISGLRELLNLGATDIGNTVATVMHPGKVKQIWGNRNNRFNQLNNRYELKAQSRLRNQGIDPIGASYPTGQGMTSPSQLRGRMMDDPMMERGLPNYGQQLPTAERRLANQKQDLWTRIINSVPNR